MLYAAANVSYVKALQGLPPALVSAIFCAAPGFVLLLSWPVLGTYRNILDRQWTELQAEDGRQVRLYLWSKRWQNRAAPGVFDPLLEVRASVLLTAKTGQHGSRASRRAWIRGTEAPVRAVTFRHSLRGKSLGTLVAAALAGLPVEWRKTSPKRDRDTVRISGAEMFSLGVALDASHERGEWSFPAAYDAPSVAALQLELEVSP